MLISYGQFAEYVDGQIYVILTTKINNIKKIADGLSITISELFVGIEILDEDKTV